MFALRLPRILESRLEEISRLEKKSKSEVLRHALEAYLEAYNAKTSVYESGKEFFGKYGSGVSDNSVNYKKKLKESIRAKRSS
ncbi:MAG TPA: transcriptional regulator [Leptospiraceae bacterium]|nr:transcriptional regulator [Leptospiraceae bacterium]